MDLSVLGRVKPLAEAELRAVASNVERVDRDFCLFTKNPKTELARLGGSIKQAEVLYRGDRLEKSKIAELIGDNLSGIEGKIQFGISVYPDKKQNHHESYTLGQLVKKNLRASAHNSRFIPPKAPFSTLNAAQLTHNKLFENGGEFLVTSNINSTLVAKTYAVQDVDWYSERDYQRPFRDSKIGMLPPKLAQIMINLAGVSPKSTIYDPFCGSGTILAEALLNDFVVAGSDIDRRLVDGATKNLAWLAQQKPLKSKPHLFCADATTVKLKGHNFSDDIAIVTEGFLGNVDHVPSVKEQANLDKLYRDFLTNMAAQIAPHTVIVIASPYWPKHSQQTHLPFLDQIASLGYNSRAFEGVDNDALIFIRAGQRTGRKISVIVRK